MRALSLISLSLVFSRVGHAEEGDAGSQASGDTGLKALTPPHGCPPLFTDKVQATLQRSWLLRKEVSDDEGTGLLGG